MTMFFPRCSSFLTALLCVCSLMSPANELDALVASVKATGMGAVGVAYPQDAMAGAYNPAGITDIGDRFDVAVTWIHDEGDTTIKGNLNPFIPNVNGTFPAYHRKDFFCPEFGINKHLCWGDWELAVGLVVFNRNASKTTYRTNFPLLGTSHLGLEYIHETFSPLLAVKFCNFSVGASFNYMIHRLKVEGLEFLDHPPLGLPSFSRYPGFVTNKGYDYAHGVNFTVGFKWDIMPCLSVGAAYQPTTTMGRFHKYRGFLAQKGLLKIPPIVSAGITYRFIPCASASFDVQYLGWNRVHSLHTPLLPNLFTHKLGDEEGAGFGWRSQWIYRFGVDWDINCAWTVRAGCRFAKSTIEPSQTAVNILTHDPAGNFVMGGFSWRPNGLIEISTYYAHGFERLIKGKNAIPPLPFGGGDVDIKQTKEVVGLSLGVNY